jgi:hypothetical protein
LKSQDKKIRSMLNDFGRAVLQAMHGSTEVHGAVRKICREGYSLHLVLDGKTEDQQARLELTSPLIDETVRPGPPAQATFRLNSDDVEFLRSVGIDPTRSVRRRRHA